MKKITGLLLCFVLVILSSGCNYNYKDWENHGLYRNEMGRQIKLPKGYEVEFGDFITIWNKSEGEPKLVATEWYYGYCTDITIINNGKVEYIRDYNSCLFNEKYADLELENLKSHLVMGNSNLTYVYKINNNGQECFVLLLGGVNLDAEMQQSSYHMTFVFEEEYKFDFVDKIACSYN